MEATNLLANGTFEGSGAGSLTGWAASDGTLSLVTGNGGGHAARVSASTAGIQAYAYTPSKPVKNLTAGAAYTPDGTVHSTTGGTVCLKLKEVPATGSTTVGSAQQCIAATSTWQAFPTVSYKAAKAGDSLTVNVVESSPAAGATFDIDNLVLAAGSTGTDGSAPKHPGERARVGRQLERRHGHLVGLERQRRRDRLRRLPRRHEGARPAAARGRHQLLGHPSADLLIAP